MRMQNYCHWVLPLAGIIWFIGCGEKKATGDAEPGFSFWGKGNSDLQFISEKIEIEITDRNNFKVQGRYYLRYQGEGSKTVKIGYPFPTDSSFSEPENIIVEVNGNTGRFDGKVVRRKVFFPVRLKGNALDSFSVRYRQKTNNNTAVYILTTTQTWEKALERGKFTIIVPDTMPGIRVNYGIDHKFRKGEKLVYEITRENFMPDQDLVVFW